MIVYWSLVLWPALTSMFQPFSHRGKSKNTLMALFIVLFLFLSLRETGGDYSTYLEFYEYIPGLPLSVVLTLGQEPGYALLNWLSSEAKLGIYGVNAACALIFLFSLFTAARKEADPLLYITLAIPYFVIVVAMGYTRQGVAAGLILLSIVQFRYFKFKTGIILIIIASCFHVSAFVATGLLMIYKPENGGRFLILIKLISLCILYYVVQEYLNDKISSYNTFYVEDDHYKSGGALLRSTVSGLAGLIFIFQYYKFKKLFDDFHIWRIFAVLAIAFVPLSTVASTPIDRMGLYLIPFQITVFSRLPLVLLYKYSYASSKALIIFGYLSYFFVWLHMGTYSAELWIPYKWLFS